MANAPVTASSQPPALLDTDTLSEVMRGRDPAVRRRALEYLRTHGWFTFSLITRYEILRGLISKGALAQLRAFEQRCRASEVLPLTDPIIIRAAEIYADLKSRGELISDADILIAATASVHSLVLITNNVEHFRRIPSLQVQTWRKT